MSMPGIHNAGGGRGARERRLNGQAGPTHAGHLINFVKDSGL